MAGRPLEFDIEIALDLAVELFWEQGYAATSITDLLEYIGVGRQSLYNTWGSKQSLFVAALDRYSEYETEEFAMLRSRDAGIDSIREFLVHRAYYLTDGHPVRACLMANAAMELATRDPRVGECVARYTRKVQRAVARAIRSAVENGEISNTSPPSVLARSLANTFFGLAVTAKTGASRATLRAIADTAVDQLTA